MTGIRRWGLVGFVVGLCALFLLETTEFLSSEGTPQTPAELWLSWEPQGRANYVWGYLSGFQEGKRAGCSFYADKTMDTVRMPVAPEKLPRQACLNALPDFAQQSKRYVDLITKYYEKYPHDRQAGIPQIMDQLASPPGLLDIDQIHRELTR